MEFIAALRRLPHRLKILFFVFALVTAALEAVSIWVLRNLLLQLIAGRSSLSELFHLMPAPIRHRLEPHIILITLLGAVIFFVIKNAAQLGMWYGALKKLSDDQADYSKKLFEHYLQVPFVRHMNHSQAESQFNLDAAKGQLANLYIPVLIATSECMVIAAIVLYLLVRAPRTTLVIGLWLCGAALVFRYKLSDSARNPSITLRLRGQYLSRLSTEVLRNFKTVKIWGLESFFGNLYRSASATYASEFAKSRLTLQMPRLVLEPIVLVSVLLFYLTLVSLGARQAMLVSDLTLYAVAAMRLVPSVQRLMNQLRLIALHHVDVEQIAMEFADPPEILPAPPLSTSEAPFERNMALESICLRYGDAEPILQNVSLTVSRGEKIVILGVSGTGKTSLLNVMLGLIEPQQGRITLDGVETRPLLRFRQTSVAFVPQDIGLLNSSVADNVAFGRPVGDVDEDRLWAALQKAGLAAAVRDMPGGLQAQLGENGIRISGGEKQRLSLARALFREPSLLILDESTSQLDSVTEAAILDELFREPGLTVIAATHRLATVSRFDRSFEIVGGCLQETVRGPRLFQHTA